MKAHQVTDSGLVAIDENAAKIEALKNGVRFRHAHESSLDEFVIHLNEDSGNYWLFQLWKDQINPATSKGRIDLTDMKLYSVDFGFLNVTQIDLDDITIL